MALDDTAISELKAMIAVAKRRDLNFGLCMGKKPEDTALILDRKKPPEVLLRTAKKEDGVTASKSTFGTLRAKGKVISLTCQSDPPPALARHCKLFLIKAGMNMKVLILDENGGLLEEDGEGDEDEDESAAGESVEDTAAADVEGSETEAEPSAAKWQVASAKIKAAMDEKLALGVENAKQIEAVWGFAEGKADQEDFAGALKALPPLVKLIQTAVVATPAGQESAPAEDSKATAWRAMQAKAMPLYESAMKTDPKNRSQLTAAWEMAGESAEGNDFDKAIKIVDRLIPSLNAALAAAANTEGSVSAKAATPDGAKQFAQARIIWSKSRTKMKSEIVKLEKAIVQACQGDEELQEVANTVGDLSARLEVFDEKLEDALDEIVNCKTEGERPELKIAAKTELNRLVSFLDEGFFAEVDSNNGFASVAVTATAKQSLGAIDKMLAG